MLEELQAQGIELWESGGELRYRAPVGALDDQVKQRLRTVKPALIEVLRATARPPLVADPSSALAPFPLTDIQAAYLLGRNRGMAYGGLPCMAYLELSMQPGATAPGRLRAALGETIRHHAALRTTFAQEGYQQVMADVPPQQVAHARCAHADDKAALLRDVRQQMLTRQMTRAADAWPGFELRLTDTPDEQVLHMAVDLLLMDFVSVELWLREMLELAAGRETAPALAITFRDAVVHRQALKETPERRRARAHWMERMEQLPVGPDLALRTGASPQAEVGIDGFERVSGQLATEVHDALLERARKHGLTPSAVFLGAFGEVLACWCRRGAFTLTVTLMQRTAEHPDLSRVLGDFTSTVLLAADMTAGDTFAERLLLLQQRLWQDLEHASFSGVEVQRELARRRGREAALFPVVFTSTMGTADPPSPEGQASSATAWRLRDGITWTPQVWLDCQVLVAAGTVHLNWDYRADVLDSAMVRAMHAAYLGVLRRLAEDGRVWEQPHPVVVPPARARASLETPYGGGLLHEGFLRAAARWPDKVALTDSTSTLRYGELLSRARSAADVLASGPAGRLVGIAMEKGAEQVVAVLAVLLSGNAYVPIDLQQPRSRKEAIVADAGVSCLLTQRHLAEQECYDGVQTQVVDLGVRPPQALAALPRVEPQSRAYLIYTSGTTGRPKGVVMTHDAATNTVLDINARIGLCQEDVVLGLSGLGFDLSVYDIFGTLAAGAHLVLPAASRRSSPGHWVELMQARAVTVWNSVPAQADMLLQHIQAEGPAALDALRCMLLSGDWVPVGLAPALQSFKSGLRVISLGGATEAAIWSIWHPIEAADAGRSSIPYGLPLTGQDVHVLNGRGQECPVGTVGEIHISGAGLALGYHGDPAKTAERFFVHRLEGQRLYRTGDLGRYMPGGEIEFLGREDQQVKIRGHRVELGEVAAVLEEHPHVASAAAVVRKEAPQSVPTIHAFVVPTALDATGFDARERARSVLSAAMESFSGAAEARVPAAALIALSEALHETVLHCVQAAFSAASADAAGGRAREGGAVLALDAPDLARRLRVQPAHTRVLYRCLCALERRGLVRRDGSHGFVAMHAPLEADALTRRWQQLHELAGPAGYPLELLGYFRDSATRFVDQLQGHVDPLALFFPRGMPEVAKATFGGNPSADLCNRLAAQVVIELADARQGRDTPLRVLEVGGGVGAVASTVLDALGDRPVQYVFTDISTYFLQLAEARFAGDARVRVAQLDVTRAGDWREPPCDVLVCGDLLHALPDVPAALSDLSGLVKPGGWLVLLEATSEHAAALVSLELMLRSEGSDGAFRDQRGATGSTFADVLQWRRWLKDAGWHCVVELPRGPLAAVGLQCIVAQSGTGLTAVDEQELMQHLKDRLPAHMVPRDIRALGAWPLTANGKVDRAALSQLCQAVRPGARAGSSVSADRDAHSEMVALWRQTLGQQVMDAATGFFDLGGDSLSAARLAGLVIEQRPRREGLHFDDVLRLLMEGPSIAEFVDRLKHVGRALPAVSDTPPHPAGAASHASRRVQLRQGPAEAQRLFLVVDGGEHADPAGRGVLHALPAELAVFGAVAIVDAPRPSEAPGPWIQEILAGLDASTWPDWCLFGLLSAVEPALQLLREALAQPRGAPAAVRCLALSSEAASGRERLGDIAPFIFDLRVLRLRTAAGDDADLASLGRSCLGLFEVIDVAGSDDAVDAALAWGGVAAEASQ
ncbi:amino acid adenylation domain-containing protein [Rubrivivax sp. RP6-9]|uniref:non-ribosomal peptide synthetase n=1 Tax=Rubrivivax sp. RP6-9 TaxID=3415750 RepID=UPI003CC6C890